WHSARQSAVPQPSCSAPSHHVAQVSLSLRQSAASNICRMQLWCGTTAPSSQLRPSWPMQAMYESCRILQDRSSSAEPAIHSPRQAISSSAQPLSTSSAQYILQGNSCTHSEYATVSPAHVERATGWPLMHSKPPLARHCVRAVYSSMQKSRCVLTEATHCKSQISMLEPAG